MGVVALLSLNLMNDLLSGGRVALVLAWMKETCLLDPKKGQGGVGGCACVL